MQSLLITALLIAAAPPDKDTRDDNRKDQATAGNGSIDGQWTVVYAEKDGKKMNLEDKSPVTIKNNTLTFKEDGKERMLRMHFGPGYTFWAMGENDRSGKEEGKNKSGQEEQSAR